MNNTARNLAFVLITMVFISCGRQVPVDRSPKKELGPCCSDMAFLLNTTILGRGEHFRYTAYFETGTLGVGFNPNSGNPIIDNSKFTLEEHSNEFFNYVDTMDFNVSDSIAKALAFMETYGIHSYVSDGRGRGILSQVYLKDNRVLYYVPDLDKVNLDTWKDFILTLEVNENGWYVEYR